MPARKRGRQEADLDSSTLVADVPKVNETLTQLRNMSEFAAFMQYLFLFGKVVKVDEDFDMDELETECLRPEPSQRLQDVGLALLKYVSSHRGLTPEIFDEYTRRQYEAKAPERNPFGEDEEPKKFLEFDVFTKIRVLHQLSIWTLGNADRIRQQMVEQTEKEQTTWRMEELGWDKEERAYYVLDDDRLYRRTEKPIPPPTPKKSKPKPKSKAKPKARGTRASKRRKLSSPPESEDEQEAEVETLEDAVGNGELKHDAAQDTFGGMKWECVAVTLEDYQDFLESIRRSADADEKALRKRILDDIMPVMEEKAEKQRQKAARKARELENLQKLATAKRSSRIAGKLEMQKKQEEEEAAEQKRLADLKMAKKEQEKQRVMEEARESRMLTREQRLKEREVKRILHEEELKRLEENSKNPDASEARMSERNLKLEMERRQKELEKLAEEEDEWVFDCAVCGLHGANLDDGSHSIACEKCSIWQHSKCHGIREEDAEREDFHFVCNDCIRKEEEARKPKIPPLRLRMGASNSPQLERARPVPFNAPPQPVPYNGPPQPHPGVPNGGRVLDGVYVNHEPPNNARFESPRPGSSHPNHLMDGPALSPQGQSPGPPGYHPHGPAPIGVPQEAWRGTTLPPPPRPTSAGYNSSPTRPQSHHHANGQGSPPPFRLHQQAHLNAVGASDLPHPEFAGNGHGNASFRMPPPSPQKSQSRPSTAYDSNAPRPSQHALNGTTLTPQQPHASSRQSMSPNSHHAAQPTLSYSPNTSFPPPSRPQQYQQAAGHSPTKPPSSSPLHAPHQPHAQYNVTPSNSQHQYNQPHADATPRSTASNNIFRPSPGGTGGPMHHHANVMHSSPIPPLPTGNTPLIPQKHDTPRPLSRDSIGDTRVFPPGVKMSPSPGTNFARPGSSSGPGASSLSFSQSFSAGSQGYDGATDSSQPSQRTLPLSEHLQQLQEPRRMSLSLHGEVAQDGGIAGVETSLGVGSVPVKKMPPQSPGQSYGRGSGSVLMSSPFADVKTEGGKSEDAPMKDT